MNKESLLKSARSARCRAYAPYSKFLVGAALLTEGGLVVTGSNIENASYGLTVCAERVAVFRALHAGCLSFKALAVVTDATPPASPCGACRQVLWEFAGNIPVFLGNLAGQVSETCLADLLTNPFGSANWAENPACPLSDEEEAAWRLPVTLMPIGYVVNSFAAPEDIPDNYKELLSEIVIDPAYEEGLYRLGEEKNIIVLAHLNRVSGYRLKGPRRGRGGEVFGVFASRSPMRPNALAQSLVELVSLKENILTVRGLDLINGTPVLDLKTDYRTSRRKEKDA